ncbi:43788_t:CDS:2 [Gigaspora margarita]|uniref:43788_t:CDS:1 n=1 Tax=Gigaspora margarita TaxID=4874 RepID=A0ABN7V0V0_GIGMA|nr:43788_t:CDS:2 [Gigaspora margarita]
MFILDPFRPSQGSDDTPPLRRWRTIIIAIISVLLTVLFAVLAEQMVEEEPSIKISYNKNSDAALMPSFPDCGKYFVNTSIEDNAIYESVSEPEMKFIWYLPNGTIKFKEKSKKFTFFIDINDPTYNNLNETDDFIINVFDSDYLSNKDKSPDYIEYLNTQNQYYITQGKDVENYYLLRFRRTKRQEIDNSFLSKIGFSPKYNTYYYTESEMQIMPYITKLNGANFFAALHIKPWTLMTEVEKEQK